MDSVDLGVLRSVLAWRQAGQRVRLYTVVQTWGSAPRPPAWVMTTPGTRFSSSGTLCACRRSISSRSNTVAAALASSAGPVVRGEVTVWVGRR